MIPPTRLKKEIAIPQGISVEIKDNTITVKGGKGVAKKRMIAKNVSITHKEDKITIEPIKKSTKKEKKMINTFRAHILNLIKGVITPYVYKLKVVSSHFPMSIKKDGDKIVISNFYGAKIPKVAKIVQGAEVKIEGDIIVVESVDKEIAGQTAANIESATRRRNYDKRKFQDGIWITQKAGKAIR